MLKIYFDWNCITHSKDDYPYILNITEECRDRFIFPFSNAHIRDLLVSHNNSNVFFDSDLNLLERICGNNYLLFENGQMLPKLGTPRDVIDISGDTLEAIQKFELISPETYHSIKEEVRKHLPSIIFKEFKVLTLKTLYQLLIIINQKTYQIIILNLCYPCISLMLVS